jgi:outer membrane receptor protein involved in Fe transport
MTSALASSDDLVLARPKSRARVAMIIFLIVVASSVPCAAEDVSGTVKDRVGAVIPSAEVVLRTTEGVLSQPTNGQGEFSFSGVKASIAEITISIAGFKTVTAPWRSGDKPLVIVLLPAAIEQTLDVTAMRTAILPTGSEDLELQPSTTVLPSAALNEFGAITVDDKLRQVPGFSLLRRSGSMTANPTSQGVSLRGLGASGASRALVLRDGIPVNDPYGSWIYWGRVPVASLDEAQVVPGGISSLYGNDALGGVINLETRSAVETNFAAEASFGNNNTPFGSMFGGVRVGQWAMSGSAEAFNTNGYIDIPANIRGSVDTPVSSEHGTGDLQVERFFGDHGRMFLDGALYGEHRDNGTPLQINATTLRELGFGTDWQSPRAGLFTLRLFGGTENYHQTFSSIAPDRNSEALTNDQHVPAQQMGLIAQWSKAINAKLSLLAGIDGQDVQGWSLETSYVLGHPTANLANGGRQQSLGAFVEGIIQLTQRWSLSLSGREDLWSNFDAHSSRTPIGGKTATVYYPARGQNSFDPRATVSYRINDDTVLYASGYRSFRAPTLNELYRSFRVGNVQTLANPYLVAEHFAGFETGVRISMLHNRLTVNGTFFWGYVTTPIENVTLTVVNGLILRQRDNLGKVQAPGFQIGANYRITDTVNFSAAYQFVDSTVISFPANPALVGNQVPLVPRSNVSFQATWAAPRRFFVALQGRAGSNEYDDDQNVLPLGSYFVLSGSVSHPLGKGINVFVAGENIANSSYEIARTPYVNLGQPILVRAGLRWQMPR